MLWLSAAAMHEGLGSAALDVQGGAGRPCAGTDVLLAATDAVGRSSSSLTHRRWSCCDDYGHSPTQVFQNIVIRIEDEMNRKHRAILVIASILS